MHKCVYIEGQLAANLWSLAMDEFSVKSFTLLMIWTLFEACLLIYVDVHETKSPKSAFGNKDKRTEIQGRAQL